ncbi:MAG: hypothetical protein GEU95_01110 [Rhizobiales bacterium]|nr:hypothetical protein [Hyphomicrobiales bacterium]
MSERGVFGVDRGIFEHHWLAGEPYTRIQAWQWLCAEAAWKPRRSLVAGMMVELERAQLAHSLSHMAKTWQWSIKRVRTFIRRLKQDDMVVIGHRKGTAKGTGLTLLTICNYDEYNFGTLPKGTAKGTPGAQQGHKPEEDRLIDGRDTGTQRAKAFEEARNPSKCTVSEDAHDLAREFLIAIGVEPEHPELYGMSGVPYAAQMWLSRGYERALILATAAEKAARYGPNKPIGFYTKCFETAHQSRPAPGQRNFPLLQTIEGNNGPRADASDFIHPAARNLSFAALGASLRRQAAARRRDDPAA